MRVQHLPLYILLLLMFITVTMRAQEPFEINGTLPPTTGKLYLGYVNSGVYTRDSAMVTGTTFSFKGSISEPGYATLTLKQEGRAKDRSIDFWVEAGKLTMVCDSMLKQTVISGGRTNDEQQAYKQWLAPVNLKYKTTLDSLSRTRNQDTIKMIRERLAPYFEELYAAETSFFRAHGDSYVTGINLSIQMARMPVDTIEQFYAGLSPRIQNSGNGVLIKTRIDKLRSVDADPAVDFTRVDILSGKNMSLSPYRGKYVLLDFWASWCVPCRKEHPEMIGLYNKYKNKPIEFIGVSVDHEDDKWRQAVQKDKLPWPQVISNAAAGDASGTKPIHTLYEVHVFPTIILIDPAGKVVGRYLGIDKAKPVLKSLLSSK
ncbi:TlpA disulfide reductase family protein [Paraflavitalea pollutisoli]|uniref:TlpA disulfide reductase family protein n=1 Tax=Paraflavitalea pollutisoli TaxID=3034143 RepID=UPI0023EAB782|nr:TlpA disulfide reductase family protein [Paraflavitalea sp. H1-2-19X]